MKNNQALDFLACEGDSRPEVLSETAPLKGRLVLKYHRGSERMGRPYGIDCRIWDVLSPRLAGYRYDANSGPVTLSLAGMRERGLIK